MAILESAAIETYILNKQPVNFERQGVDWRTLKISPDTYEFLEHMSQREYDSKVKYIVLFGSVARGQARLGSDIDIAIISDEPLTKAEFDNVHPSVDYAHFYSLDYRMVNVATQHLSSDKLLNVGYHIRRDGVIIYDGWI